jgi:hypothetical protein
MRRRTHNVAIKATKSTKSPKVEVFGKNGVFYTFPQGDGGPININVDFSLAPPPPSYYYADSIRLKTDEDLQMVNLSFGRRKPDANEFEDNIDIVMPMASLCRFWTYSRDVEAAVDLVLAQVNWKSRVQPISAGYATAATLFANMIFMAIGEGESSLDFYHLPPREVHLAKTQKMDMQLVPIVRVILSSIVTKYFFSLVETVARGGQSQLFAQGRERATASR